MLLTTWRFGVFALVLHTSLGAQEQPFALVPYPARLVPGAGAFTVTVRTRVVLDGPRSRELDRHGALLSEVVREVTGLAPPVQRRRVPGAIVLRRLRDDTTARESYSLLVTPDSVVIAAPGDAGLFYGIQSLRQLVPRQPPIPSPPSPIPSVFITDAPRFPWRGMHLDVGRHRFPVEFLERYIDLLARYKLNTFHWHLTEDQGWRLEIRRFPRLTDVGGCRRETVVARNFDPYVGDGTPYCGFYTQDEVRRVVRYAAQRHVTVVPEIEMPGHSVAALAAYPELACTPGPFEVRTTWGVSEDVLCPHEATFTFLEQVLSEVLELFPSIFVHIGGDEVPKTRWRASPAAQEVIRREGLRDEAELQSWFIRRVERFLNARGRRLVGWDEILEGGLPPQATVMSWRGVAGGVEAARQGHDVVMTPTSHLYFDYYQGDPRFEPLAIGGLLPLEQVYAYEPVPPELTPEEARHVLGAQGNVWTEYMPTGAQVEFMALPRMLALAEVAWSPREARVWNGFATRLPARLDELDRLGVQYRVPGVVGLEEDRLTLADTVVVRLGAAVPEAVIRYTLDGTDPTPASAAYTDPVTLRLAAAGDSGIVVTARAFRPNGRASPPRAARFTRATLRAGAAVDTARLVPGVAVRLSQGRIARLAELVTLPPRLDTAVPGVGIPTFAPAEDFALDFTGFARVPEDGIWRFRLTSDDGSALWIGGTLVVGNDGLHGPEERSGYAALRAGLHPMRVAYFQRGGGRGLSLIVEREDGSGRTPVAPWLFRPR